MKSVVVWISLLMIALAVPMVLRKVPPNGFYGFRTPKTMSSPEIWYKSNRKAGINLLLAGVLTLAVWGVTTAVSGQRWANVLGMPIFLASLAGSFIVSLLQIRRL